ncbi:MAG: fumarylacetoacetate hydrolase family protein, partial [Xanthomonadales bacterium]|nr:fumarylacetoacetate hydrolase family protein [Xanthomonadales bacterium]
MYTSLTRHATDSGPRWAVDGRYLPTDFRLSQLLRQRAADLPAALAQLPRSEPAQDPLLAPLEPEHEVWASGVTYLSSRMAREAESSSKDVYQKVYAAERPELFFKACGWRVVGHGERIRIRADSAWNVPEPELTLVLNRHGEIVGYTVGNDVSSRSIEGENPLYLPQAKVYDGSCALGPAIRLCGADSLR